MARLSPEIAEVVSPLPAIFDEQSRVLILGTLPSPKSREYGFHYGHPQNRFWPTIAALWGEVPPTSIEGRRSLLRRHHLALHDVLARADISGASDASIANPVANDLTPILVAAPIAGIFCTGQTAGRLYRRLIEPALGVPCTVLPSTSPANARWSKDALVKAYEPVRALAEGTTARLMEPRDA